jgi:hypothetical protein
LGDNVVRLVAKSDECRNSTIETLKALLAEAEAGQVITVTGIAENSDGTYRNFGSTTMSRLQTSGALLEAAINRLTSE